MKVIIKAENVKRFLIENKKLQKKEIDVLEKEYRSQRKLLIRCYSQNWLAHKLEISSGYMSQLMDGSRNPSPKLRERMMEIIPKYTWDDLFKIKEEVIK